MAVQSLTAWLSNDAVKKKIEERLGKDAQAFITTLNSIYAANTQLQNCDGRSVLGAAFLATALKLSISPSLGQAYIVPFKGRAQFQVGVRGYVQLAHRTGQYVRLHAGKVYQGEFLGFNTLTGEPIPGEKESDKVIGYVAYMKLTNGFEKTIFMSIDEIEAHAEKFSQSYGYDKRSGKNSSPWSTNFDEMASKTVLKKLLRQWGVMSADMVTALGGDQSVVDKNTFTYTDNGGGVQNREELYLPEEPEAGEVAEAVSD